MKTDIRRPCGSSWRTWAGWGWPVPEEYGGQGLPLTYLGLVMEELGRVLAPGASAQHHGRRSDRRRVGNRRAEARTCCPPFAAAAW